MAERAMPQFPKSPPELVERFGEIVGRYPNAKRKAMFGYPSAVVDGNMATSLFGSHWIVRLPDAEIAAAEAAGATPFEVMPGRAMKGFVVIPDADVTDESKLVAWVERGLAHAASMPAKKK
jgi:TfoX N-terminal domain